MKLNVRVTTNKGSVWIIPGSEIAAKYSAEGELVVVTALDHFIHYFYVSFQWSLCSYQYKPLHYYYSFHLLCLIMPYSQYNLCKNAIQYFNEFISCQLLDGSLLMLGMVSM